MSAPAVWTLDARAIAEQVRAGTLAPEAAMLAGFDRPAERWEREVHAVVHTDPETRLANALAANHAGPLAGVPVLLKDNLCSTDFPTTCGSRILAGWRSPYDATVVQRLRAAGAVVVGKGNMDEFAMGSSTEYSAYGPTRNPWDLKRVPGGSSGGPAAAVAYGLVRVFGRWSLLLTLLFTIPLFVSENIRLYGWVLFLIKNGVLLGTLKSMFGVELESMLFSLPAIILGMVYVYLPFMLFPMTLGIGMVPDETCDAASDLGASRWQVFTEVELPLSMPGVVIGFLLTFVLAVGAIAEAKVLGGQQVIPIAHDIEIAFTYAQNWPLGAALSVLLMLVVGVLVLLALRRFDLDRFLGRR